VSTSARLSILSVLVAIGAVAAYVVHERGGPDGQDVPRPATIVLDQDGVVRWFSVSRNFQVRPDPRDVLRAVRAL
jgi:peroxiredoxin